MGLWRPIAQDYQRKKQESVLNMFSSQGIVMNLDKRVEWANDSFLKTLCFLIWRQWRDKRTIKSRDREALFLKITGAAMVSRRYSQCLCMGYVTWNVHVSLFFIRVCTLFLLSVYLFLFFLMECLLEDLFHPPFAASHHLRDTSYIPMGISLIIPLNLDSSLTQCLIHHDKDHSCKKRRSWIFTRGRQRSGTKARQNGVKEGWYENVKNEVNKKRTTLTTSTSVKSTQTILDERNINTQK